MDYAKILSILSETFVTLMTLTLPVIATYVVTWLRAHVGEKATQSIVQEAEHVVSAVEQMYKNGEIPKDSRFDYALSILQKAFPKANPTQLETYIEATVGRQNTWKPIVPVVPDELVVTSEATI